MYGGEGGTRASWESFVDDIILAADQEAMLGDFAAALKGAFNVDDRGQLKWALGMLITCDRVKRTITICCEARIKAMVERYAGGAGAVHNRNYATPTDKTVLELYTAPTDRDQLKAIKKDAKKSETRSLIGALIFSWHL